MVPLGNVALLDACERGCNRRMAQRHFVVDRGPANRDVRRHFGQARLRSEGTFANRRRYRRAASPHSADPKMQEPATTTAAIQINSTGIISYLLRPQAAFLRAGGHGLKPAAAYTAFELAR